MKTADLSAQFRTDGSTGSRNYHPFPLEISADFVFIKFDCFPTDKISVSDLSNRINGDLAVDQLWGNIPRDDAF